MDFTLQHLEDESALRVSFDLMGVLRPHLRDPGAYSAQLLRQMAQGYRLLAAWQGHRLVGLAGYREMENLIYSRFIYVDDLVVSPDMQRSGLGSRLLSCVRDEAVRRQCDHLVLDTGLHMALAQRFYFRQGLLAQGMHFTQKLTGEQP
ncbi:GNAT family N-acetyltransferase [Pseudomonas psychrophila]|jgi:ribosomal protein S18 acetylase RimI-like enzyme|uniref:GNAT family N-acetyltransferase n=2 Tax=Pseudomonas psychrophila TaxID=122355 RepID=A0A8I1FR02_9PSED|nr:GNAT family N-acetyltransferase [Pseudomonas psychrophila]EPJ95319.1 PhnO-related protein [Pseudomonas psychrophila]MBJ2255470.1 GNAT family N-acetyltransferase [Pseudomonas psychrophila]